MQVAAQHEIPVQVDGLPGLQHVPLGQVVPGVVQQGQAPVRSLGVRVQHGLMDLIAPEQQTVAVSIAAGHPGGVEPGEMQALTVEVQGALPPGQRLRLAEPGAIEVQIVVVAV